MNSPSKRAFSLIELLVVILIIGVLVALVVPTVGKVRDAAKSTENKTLISQIQQACSAFQIDNRRAPGYFSPLEMGANENAARGFSGMQNAMLDLAGGVVDKATTASLEPTEIVVGPRADNTKNVVVNLALMGSGKAYFTPPGKFFQRQDGVEGGDRLGGQPNDTPHELLPEVVDRYGQPVLFWSRNDQASGDIESRDDVVRVTSNGNAPSRFYWNQNAAFLSVDSGSTGALRVNQGATGGQSMIGEWAGDRRLDTMMAILGNPNSPVAATASGQNATLADVLPAQVRGAYVIQAAGRDGAYLGYKDNTSRLILNQGTSFWLHYGETFYAPSNTTSGVRRTGSSGPNSVDLGAAFDDVIVAGE